MRNLLVNIYEEILEFHLMALKYFRKKCMSNQVNIESVPASHALD